jgi:Flp pilus assembly protein TadD
MSEAYQLFQKGLAALASGHADEAIVPLERARNMEPESMSIHEALGKTYLRLGFYDRAVTTFSTILEKEPIDAYAHFCLARAYDRLGEVKPARKHYRLATFFAPDRAIYRDTLRVFLARAYPDGDAHEHDDDDDEHGGFQLPKIFGD